MKSKESQAQIITTVLIILLVLAAIIIVWQFIQGTISSGTSKAEKQAQCIGIDLKAIAINSSDNKEIKVSRGAGENKKIDGYIVLINGAKDTERNVGLSPTETDEVTLTKTLQASDEIAIAAKIGNIVCPSGIKVKVSDLATYS